MRQRFCSWNVDPFPLHLDLQFMPMWMQRPMLSQYAFRLFEPWCVPDRMTQDESSRALMAHQQMKRFEFI